MQRADPGQSSCPRKPRPGGQVGTGADRSGGGGLILGAIIAGGQARRFGSDKALALWRGRPLIDWAHDALRPWCERVVVCGREWGGLTALPDRPAPGSGPLGGIAAALAHAEQHGFASVLTIGCDMPEVPDALLAGLALGAPAYCPDAPVLGHWLVDAVEALMRLLETCTPAKAGVQSGFPPSREYKSSSIRGWAEAIGARSIPALIPLRNINTPADLTS